MTFAFFFSYTFFEKFYIMHLFCKFILWVFIMQLNATLREYIYYMSWIYESAHTCRFWLCALSSIARNNIKM